MRLKGNMKPCLMVLFMSITLIIGCDLEKLSEELGMTSKSEDAIYMVEYQVTGTTSKADVNFLNANGGHSQFNDVSLPWTHSFIAKSGQWLRIEAKNKGGYGRINTEIYINSIKQSSSSNIGDEVKTEASSTVRK